MRVLWLSSNPALGAELLGVPLTHGGGWVAALEGALEKHSEIELSIAFPWAGAGVRRIVGGRHDYLAFPNYPRGGRLRRLLVDLSCRLAPESEVDHLERVVELSRPHLIHVWGTETYFGLVAERCDLPVLIEIQGPRTPYTEVYLQAFGKLDLLRFGSPKRLLSGRSLLHRYFRYRRSARREQRILAGARFVVGRTAWDRSVCASLAPAARYFHCDRVLRPPFYGAGWRRRTGGGALRLISALRGNAYKGIETVSRCAELLPRLLAGGFQWTLVGIRPGDEVQRVVERKLGVSFERQGLRLAGRQPAEEVRRRLLESDMYVLPSRIENSPNGLCEAMALGLPVVSTNVGGIPSLIDDRQEGLLVPPGDPRALASAIHRLARDSCLADRLAAAARRRALRRHDPATVSGSLLEIYREVLGAGRESS